MKYRPGRWFFWLAVVGLAVGQTWLVRQEDHHGDFGIY